MPDEILMEKMDVFNRVIAEFVTKTSELQKTTDIFVEICRIFDCIEGSLGDLAKSAFVYCLESCNPQENKIEHNLQSYYFKEVRVKEFLTRYGTIKIKRRVYMSQSGESIIPLDESWQMEGQYAELKIREMIAYLSASNTPAEVETIFKRFLSCTPSRDFIRETADGIGELMESHYQEILAEARQEESIPPETCVVSVSLDGVNVPLREFGPKHGRPAELRVNRIGKYSVVGRTRWLEQLRFMVLFPMGRNAQND